MSWGAALVASLTSALDRPRWWALALAGFLLRGGLLVFLVPIVILPTPAGLANAIAPTLVGFVFGSPSDSFIALVVGFAVSITLWLILGGLLAAWIEVGLVSEVAEIVVPGLTAAARSGLAWRALLVRLASHLPLAIALAWGVARLVDAIYTELITSGNVVVPIVVRVALRIPEVIVLTLLAWLAGEAAGGLAVRHLVLDVPPSAGRALARGWRDLAVRPTSLATLLATSLVVLLVGAPAAAAAGFAWERVRIALSGSPEIVAALSIGSFVSIWLAGLALVSAAVAWRSAAWTLEAARRRIPGGAIRHAGDLEAV